MLWTSATPHGSWSRPRTTRASPSTASSLVISTVRIRTRLPRGRPPTRREDPGGSARVGSAGAVRRIGLMGNRLVTGRIFTEWKSGGLLRRRRAPVPRRQGTRRAGGGARPLRRAPACLPGRRRPHAPSAGPAGPSPRQTVVRLPGWSYKPSRYVTGPASTSYPPGRSPGRKAPWWRSALASRSLAPPSTAWHAPWATAAASSSHPTTRTLLRRRGLASWPAAAGIRRRALRHLRPAAAGPR